MKKERKTLRYGKIENWMLLVKQSKLRENVLLMRSGPHGESEKPASKRENKVKIFCYHFKIKDNLCFECALIKVISPLCVR